MRNHKRVRDQHEPRRIPLPQTWSRFWYEHPVAFIAVAVPNPANKIHQDPLSISVTVRYSLNKIYKKLVNESPKEHALRHASSINTFSQKTFQ